MTLPLLFLALTHFQRPCYTGTPYTSPIIVLYAFFMDY
jgi:hypothetical protein